MPTSPPRPCGKCGARVVRAGLCQRHYSMADRQRGTAFERGYNSAGHRVGFRAAVLFAAFYRCAITGCPERATIADHYPRTRKQLMADGDNPDDPQFGRALCKRHHDQHTAEQSRLGRSDL